MLNRDKQRKGQRKPPREKAGNGPKSGGPNSAVGFPRPEGKSSQRAGFDLGFKRVKTVPDREGY